MTGGKLSPYELVDLEYKDYKNTTDRLVANLRTQLAYREAELRAIKTKISNLLIGHYMPNPRSIEMALHPTASEINSYIEKEPIE